MVQQSTGDEDVNPLVAEGQQLNEAENEIVAEIGRLAEREEREAAEVPASLEVPAPPPEAPVPPPAPLPPQEDLGILRRQLEEQRQQIEQYQTQQQRQALDDTARQYQAQLEAQGWRPEEARVAVNERRQATEREMLLRQQAQQQNLYLQGKMNAAMFYGEKYGISARSLMRYNDPDSMEEAAKQAARIATLEKEVAESKKGRVSPQKFASNQQTATPPSSERQWQDAYNGGDRSPQAVAAGKKAAGL